MAERFLVCSLQMANAAVTLRNIEMNRSKMMRLGATAIPTDPIDVPVRGGLGVLRIMHFADYRSGQRELLQISGRLRRDEQAVR